MINIFKLFIKNKKLHDNLKKEIKNLKIERDRFKHDYFQINDEKLKLNAEIDHLKHLLTPKRDVTSSKKCKK